MDYTQYKYNDKILKPSIRYRYSLEEVAIGKIMNRDDHAYFLYDNAHADADSTLLRTLNLRHDLAILPPGFINGECEYMRTFGHYHKHMINGEFMPEILQVIEGSLLLIIQDFKMEKAFYVTLKANESFIIPPDYAHVNINISNKHTVFSSLCSDKNTHYYKPIIERKGMAYFYCENGFIKNDLYAGLSEIIQLNPICIIDFFNINVDNIYSLIYHPKIVEFLSLKQNGIKYYNKQLGGKYYEQCRK